MKKYAMVGAGGRSTMFLDAVSGIYWGQARLVGLCDISTVRMRWRMNRLVEKFGAID